MLRDHEQLRASCDKSCELDMKIKRKMICKTYSSGEALAMNVSTIKLLKEELSVKVSRKQGKNIHMTKNRTRRSRSWIKDLWGRHLFVNEL